MTRIPQPPSLGFKSVDLELRVQVIIACPLQSFRNHQYYSESSEKVTLRCTMRPWVHMASTAIESFLFRS